MYCGFRNKLRWSGLGLLLISALLPAGAAAAGTPESTLQIPSVAAAGAEVLRSEQHLAEVTAARDAANRSLVELDATSARLVTEIADARSDLRNRATGAFVSPDPDSTVLVLLGGEDLYNASARVNLTTHAAALSGQAVERFNSLKRGVDPRIVEAGVALQRLEQDVADANDAVLAARATEAEAERQAQLIAAQERAARAIRAALAAMPVEPTRAPTTTVARSTAAAFSAPPSASASDDPGASPAVAPPPASSPAVPLIPTVGDGPSAAQWAALRNCESTGNYRAVSASGKYRGAYQFDYRTWAGLGGTGDPAAASPAEQDARAKLLYSQRGWRPWPVCGRFLR